METEAGGPCEHKIEVSLGNIARPHLKNKERNQLKNEERKRLKEEFVSLTHGNTE
jgi:hypothetical protein